MLDFLEDERVLGEWRRYGGLEALFSYGVSVCDAMAGTGFDRTRLDFEKRLPESHLKFLMDTKLSWQVGDYFFCHAGVRPDVPLEQQRPEDLLWIREPFLSSSRSFGKIVVHGHTPSEGVESLHNRINVDTGAYATGALTCVVLDGATRRFLST